MSRTGLSRIVRIVVFFLIGVWLFPPTVGARADVRGSFGEAAFLQYDKPGSGDKEKKKKKRKHKKKRKKKGEKKKTKVIRWGQRPSESNKKYDKRYQRLLKHIKQDKRGDLAGGIITKNEEPIRMWTYMGHPFIVRTDIDKKFTADTTMYMEMLHREYGAAYKKFLGVKADLREPIEVIVFADRQTYIENGGVPGSGGFFLSFAHLTGDRGPFWKAKHYRLQQFTDGIKDFTKWPKGTLKHEAAHMELQLRLGMKGDPRYGGLGIPIDCPRWFNEGHASVFEYWDFDKSVDENMAEVSDRGRYAPVIRRLHDTDRWKGFHYVWTIDPETWSKDMTSQQGFLNYAQAWSLCAYMMTGGKTGHRDFRAVFDLSKRVGVDRQTTTTATGRGPGARSFPRRRRPGWRRTGTPGSAKTSRETRRSPTRNTSCGAWATTPASSTSSQPSQPKRPKKRTTSGSKKKPSDARAA